MDRNDLYPFGPTVGDGRLPRNDDEFFAVDLSIIFPYFDEGERSLFVSNHHTYGNIIPHTNSTKFMVVCGLDIPSTEVIQT